MLGDFEPMEPAPEPPKRRFSLSRRAVITLAIVGGLVMLLCIGGILVTAMLMNTPLGPALEIPLEIPTAAAFPTQQPTAAPDQPTQEPAVLAPTATPKPTAAPAAATVCGQSGAMNILLMGVDSPVPALPKGPLAMRIVKVDFSNQVAVLFSIPRDLWVNVTGLEGLGVTKTTLGQAYLKAVSQAGYTETGAINIVATALSSNFSARADHYVSIRLSNLALLIDSLGGVDVNVPAPFDGRTMGLPIYTAGYHHMTGRESIAYGAAPTALDQWNAANRQNQVLQALRAKVLSPAVLPNIPSLVNQFFQIVATDLTPKQIVDLSCIAQQITADRTVVSGVAPSDVTPSADGALIPIGDLIRAKAIRLLGK
jgi:LCP family protein required for cell wall assembly